jgi:DNA polymerase/3'-5' exonuclease PolX
MNRAEAIFLAQLLALDLRPVCTRLELAGSVRREKQDPKDIELVAIAGIESEERCDLFGQVVSVTLVNRLEDRLQELLELPAGWAWQLDEELPRNGPRYKRLRHKVLGICCDLFLTSERGWGGAMAIRTGPADFSQALVTLARRQGKHVADGYLIHGHPKPRLENLHRPGANSDEEYPCPKGAACPLIIPTLEEGAFFAALGLPYWDPAARTAELVWKKTKGEAE